MNGPEKGVPQWLVGAADWQALLNHFHFSHAFSFIPLLVPSEDVANTCRLALEAQLLMQEKTMQVIPIRVPADLEQLAGTLLCDPPGTPGTTACIWVSRVVSQDVRDYAIWRDAWRRVVSSLNQFRNPLSRHSSATLVFAGAPWLKRILREDAPDLWSIRSLVAEIEPRPDMAGDGRGSRVDGTREPAGPAPDPELALAALAKLSLDSDSIRVRVRLLLRAAEGSLERRDFSRSADLLQQAVDLQGRNENDEAAETQFLLGRVAQEQFRFEPPSNTLCGAWSCRSAKSRALESQLATTNSASSRRSNGISRRHASGIQNL